MEVPQKVVDTASAMFDAALDRMLLDQMNGLPVSGDAMTEAAEFVWNEAFGKGYDNGYDDGVEHGGCDYCRD